MKQLHDNLYVAGQINIDDFKTLAKAGIKTIINNRPDQEEPGQLSAASASELAASHGIDYHYLPMANGQPMPATLVDDFKTALDNSEGAVLAHCRSGMRSSFIWAIGQLQAGNLTVDEVINAAQNAGIPLANQRPILESIAK